MFNISPYFAFVFLLQLIQTQAISIGSIQNASLWVSNTTSLLINGTCRECLCQLMMNSDYGSFNCYQQNQTCQMHWTFDQNESSTRLVSITASILYFLSPTNFTSMFITASTTLATTTTSPAAPNIDICQANSSFVPTLFWSFDSASLSDSSLTYNFTAINGISFSNSTITGNGLSLFFNASLSQQLIMDTSFANLSFTSWTFELWIYMPLALTSPDYALIGLCPFYSTDECLHLNIRQQTPYFGFFNDDLGGNQVLSPLKWYHLAFTFDCSTRNQSIYINGILDNTRQSGQCFRTSQGLISIGYTLLSPPIGDPHYNGLLDQLSYTNRTKLSNEILDDATLAVYLPFDNPLCNDQGPLNTTVSRIGSLNFTTGKVGGALMINNISHSFLQIIGLVLFGTANQSYSIALWLSPNAQKSSTLLLVTTSMPDVQTCIPILALSNSNQVFVIGWPDSGAIISGPNIPLNQWTHLTITYGSTNGLRLYINGTIFSSSSVDTYSTANVAANNLFVGGTSANTTSCGESDIFPGQYVGLVDEFRLYTRELSVNEIFSFANP